MNLFAQPRRTFPWIWSPWEDQPLKKRSLFTTRARRTLALLGILIMLVVLPARVGASSGQDLSELLVMMGRLSELYGDSALNFTCVERITQTRFRSLDRIGERASHTFDYFYVFNTVEEAAASGGTVRAGLRDYRTEPGVAVDGEAGRISPAELGLAFLSRAYSWIFVFGVEASPNYVFIQEPDGTALGRPSYVIGFEPRLPVRMGLNDWSGRAWIDKETMQLLRVEAVTSAEYLASVGQRAANRTEGGLNVATADDLYGFTHAEVEFAEQKNGLRFPSRSMLTGTLIRLDEKEPGSYRQATRELLERGIKMNKTYRVEQAYRDYRFFSVRTEAEVRQHLRDQGSP